MDQVAMIESIRPRLSRGGVGVLSAVLLMLVATVGSVAAAPCTVATSACQEWVALQPAAGRTLVYRTYRLTTRNEEITRALIVVHGGNRDADNYFRTAVSAAVLADALQNTVVLSPRFASNSGSCHDVLANDEAGWDCGEGGSGGWRSGSPAISNGRVTSFDVMDRLVTALADRKAFPNLRMITVAGFSAGGQYVSRYQMVNRVHEQLAVPVSYVVASPSSYGYLDSSRPTPASASFGQFAGASDCPAYNRWPYGLVDRTGYSAKVTDDEIRRQLVSRPVTFLVGQLETPDSPALDLACPAMAQGASRMARAEAFFRFISDKYGARHKMLVVPQCGHSARCVLTADAALPALFPKTE